MSDLRNEFEQAAADVKRLPQRPDNDSLLKLYALYKQVTAGDQKAPQPGFFDFIGHAKHEAWSRLLGVAPDEAMRRYIALVRQLSA